MKLINLTPHAIRISGETETVIEPSGTVARVSSSYEEEMVDGMRIFKVKFGEVVGLPATEAGVGLIVSGMVAAACHHRGDVFSPATGHQDCVRKDGQVWSVPGLIQA